MFGVNLSFPSPRLVKQEITKIFKSFVINVYSVLSPSLPKTEKYESEDPGTFTTQSLGPDTMATSKRVP